MSKKQPNPVIRNERKEAENAVQSTPSERRCLIATAA